MWELARTDFIFRYYSKGQTIVSNIWRDLRHSLTRSIQLPSLALMVADLQKIGYKVCRVDIVLIHVNSCWC